MEQVRRTEPVEAARSLEGGSALTEHRTATSDPDIVVVLPGPPAPFRETFEHAGWVVETFVHTRVSLDVWWDEDLARRSWTTAGTR